MYTSYLLFMYTYIDDDGESDIGAIVGGILGGIVLLVIVLLILFIITYVLLQQKNHGMGIYTLES